MTSAALNTDQKGFGIHTMNTGDGDVELLSRAILSEARAEAEELKAHTQNKADAVRQSARQEADRERAQILDQAQREAERLRSQAVATAQLKARSTELQQREKLLDQVFEEVRGKIESAPQRKDYEQFALQLIREGIEQLKTPEIQVSADAQTAKILTPALLEKLKTGMNVRLSLGPALKHGTGVVLQTPAGHLRYDNTLETRLARLQSTLRAAVYSILIGEAK